MRVALDTNRYIDLCKGVDDVVETLERAANIYLPFIVLGELRAGFLVGNKKATNEQTLFRFLNKTGVEILYSTDSTTRAYATLFKQLRTQGTPIPTNDLWIAALVVEHELSLCSRDTHFNHLPQVMIV